MLLIILFLVDPFFFNALKAERSKEVVIRCVVLEPQSLELVEHTTDLCVNKADRRVVATPPVRRKRVIDGTGSGTLTRWSQGLRIKLYCNLVAGVGLSGQREGRGGSGFSRGDGSGRPGALE